MKRKVDIGTKQNILEIARESKQKFTERVLNKQLEKGKNIRLGGDLIKLSANSYENGFICGFCTAAGISIEDKIYKISDTGVL